MPAGHPFFFRKDGLVTHQKDYYSLISFRVYLGTCIGVLVHLIVICILSVFDS